MTAMQVIPVEHQICQPPVVLLWLLPCWIQQLAFYVRLIPQRLALGCEEFPKALQTDDNIPLSLKKSGSLAARDLMAVAIALLGRVKLFDEKTIAKLSAKYLPKNKEE